jgi:hypothetical protein
LKRRRLAGAAVRLLLTDELARVEPKRLRYRNADLAVMPTLI